MDRVQTFTKCIRENDNFAQFFFAKAQEVADGDRTNPSGLTAAQVLQFMRAYVETKRGEQPADLAMGRLLQSDAALRTLHNAHVVLTTLGFHGESADAVLGDTNGDGVVNDKDVRVTTDEENPVGKSFAKARVVHQTLHRDPDNEEEQERMRKDRSFRKVVGISTS